MSQKKDDQKMLDEYDFSQGARGKYAEKYTAGSNVIVIDPDVAEYFSDSKAINDALRSFIPVIQKNAKKLAEQSHGH